MYVLCHATKLHTRVEIHILHTYIHTYLHTYIHTYIHTYTCVDWGHMRFCARVTYRASCTCREWQRRALQRRISSFSPWTRNSRDSWRYIYIHAVMMAAIRLPVPYYVYVCIPYVHAHTCSQAGFVWLQYACQCSATCERYVYIYIHIYIYMKTLVS